MVDTMSLSNDTSDAERSTTPRLSTSYSCNSCHISFRDGPEQRIHMKEPWHVNNIKRRLASLPPLSLDVFNAHIDRKLPSSKKSALHRYSSSTDEDVSEDEHDEQASPFQCLFCSDSFAEDDLGLATNLEHMRTVHGMSIPDPELMTDVESFVEYLATEVRIWHECLYCGATKSSTRNIQNHMRDKGHCLLNLDREPELLEFWDRNQGPDSDDSAIMERSAPMRLSDTEMQFESGKVISSRHATPTLKKVPRAQNLAVSSATAVPQDPEDAEASQIQVRLQLPSARELSRRDEMSLQGSSVQQRQALVLAVKKAQRSEATARRAREWVYAKGANLQKHDQIDTTGKKGKQNHKLQPR